MKSMKYELIKKIWIYPKSKISNFVYLCALIFEKHIWIYLHVKRRIISSQKVVPTYHNYHSHHQLPNISVRKCKNNSSKILGKPSYKIFNQNFCCMYFQRCNKEILERQQLIKNSIASTFKLQQAYDVNISTHICAKISTFFA